MTKAPATLTYASVVSRETVRIALTVAAINDVDVWAADVLNAYITAPCREKVWTTLGPEFGTDCGKKAIVVRALYGLKSSGAAFRAHLQGFMKEMGYKPSKADPDLWWKEQTDSGKHSGKPKQYYAYILCYVDDLLVIHHNPKKVMDKINGYLPLKEDSVGPPEFYLGAKLRKHTFDDGSSCWGLSPAKYVQQAVKNCETYLQEKLDGKYSLPKRAENPFPTEYRPEEDVSELLEPSEATYYMQLIGILRWMCEIGRLDICTETSMLSSFSAMPRKGHMEAVLHIMGYLKLHSNSRLMFDPLKPDVSNDGFVEYHEWGREYEEAEELLPPDAPKPLGEPVLLRMFVDSDHAGDKVSRRSRSGFVITLNHGVIDWLSKKQSTVESSVFGAEFCAMKHGIENLRGIRYKLRMMGVPIDGASRVYGDNMSVVTNSSKPESTLKKKSNSVCYHAVRESVAMGETLVTHIPTQFNLADLFTKVLCGQTRKTLVSRLLWDVYPRQ
jgi:histone deacetylase 1/2